MAREFGPSATTLTWGLGLLLPGALVAFWVRGFSDGDGGQGLSSGSDGLLVVLGVGAAAVGLVMTLIGVWQLATNVDIAARAAHDGARAGEPGHGRADREAAGKASARATSTEQVATDE